MLHFCLYILFYCRLRVTVLTIIKQCVLCLLRKNFYPRSARNLMRHTSTCVYIYVIVFISFEHNHENPLPGKKKAYHPITTCTAEYTAYMSFNIVGYGLEELFIPQVCYINTSLQVCYINPSPPSVLFNPSSPP